MADSKSETQALFDQGLNLRREVLGAEYVDGSLARANDFMMAFQRITTEWCWGYAWTRPGLERKTRSMLNLAMLTALNRPAEIKLHVKGALNNGVSVEEIRKSCCRPPSIAAFPPGWTRSRLPTRCWKKKAHSRSHGHEFTKGTHWLHRHWQHGLAMATRLVQAGFDVTAFDARPGQAEEFATDGCTGGARLRNPGASVGPGIHHAADQRDRRTSLEWPDRRVGRITAWQRGHRHEFRCARPYPQAGGACRGGRLGNGGCPVSGGVPRARSGELAIMFGGPAATLARVRGALEAMGRSIMPTGDVGSAHAMKALNNLVSAGGFLIGVEAMLIGQQFGLDPDVIVDVLNASTGMNNSTQKKFKQFVLSRKFDSGFGLDLMVKDLGIALDIGANTGTPTPFASLCRDLWASAAKVLGNGQDHTAVARLSERLAGAELSRRRATENMQQAIGTRPVGFAAS